MAKNLFSLQIYSLIKNVTHINSKRAATTYSFNYY